jgi:hypothetical protein
MWSRPRSVVREELAGLGEPFAFELSRSGRRVQRRVECREARALVSFQRGGERRRTLGDRVRRPHRSTRNTLDDWIRTTTELDGFVDFDAATRDASASARLRPAFASGDFLDPDNAGYEAMGGAISLPLLQ